MPTYSYRCKHCDHELDAVQRMSEEPFVECPVCHHDELFRVITTTPFQFKGLGWSEGNNPHEKIDRIGGRVRTKYGTKTIDPHTKQILKET